MSITDILDEALDQVESALLVGIISTDGLGVEMLLASDDLPFAEEDAEIELSGLTAAAANVAGRLGVGSVYDLMVETEDMTYLASQIIPGYYAVLGVFPDGNLGRARFAIRQMVGRLQTEL